ncbi:MAG: class I adenylate-forming enzyme family protein [Bacteroidota bacterium]
MALVHSYLQDTAARFPDRVALTVGADSWTFGRLERDSDQLAAALQARGVGRGDRVAALLDNSAELVVTMWAALKAGAVFVPINHGVKAEKLGFILADAGVSCLVALDSLRARVVSALAEAPTVATVIWVGVAPDSGASLASLLAGPQRRPVEPGLIDQDLCLLIYTSGSTGQPKGVMMSHRSIHNNVWSISTYLGNTPEDVVLCVLPLSFDYGLFQVLTGARVGFSVVLEKSFAFPYEILKRIDECKVTGLPGVPTIFATLLQFAPFEGLDLSSLRYLSNTAAPFPPAHITRLRELLPQATIFSMFGLTECTRVSYLDPARLEAKITSVGRAMPNSETYIVDDNGCRLGAGEIGELVVRGTSLMRGYWRRPEETARTLRPGEIPGEMVLYTGDLFRMDEDGDLYFVGRKDDVFKCRGEKVSPREIENVLYEMSEVAEAAVIGIADPIDGMAIKAFVVARPGMALTEQDVFRHCRARLESQLQPRVVELCAALPKTDSGKITKSVLRTSGAEALTCAE